VATLHATKLAIKNSTFCSQYVLVCFVWSSEQAPISSYTVYN